MGDDQPQQPPPSAARQGALMGLTIGVAMAAGRLTSDGTQVALGGTGSLVAGVAAAVVAAVVVATVAQRLLSPRR